MRKSDSLVFTLSKRMIIFLFVYYFIILVVGEILSIWIVYNLNIKSESINLMKDTFIVSLSVTGMLCSIQYIKRLYKACITSRIDFESIECKRIGNMAYFLFRPFFAFGFDIIMIFALLSGLFFVTGNLDYLLNEKFLYLCVIISSFIGFSIGKVLDKYETVSDKKIENML